jgi:hypothetical protein
MAEQIKKRFRCAVYTRKSTDEGLDQISQAAGEAVNLVDHHNINFSFLNILE